MTWDPSLSHGICLGSSLGISPGWQAVHALWCHHADFVAMCLEDVLEVDLPLPIALPRLLGLLQVHPLLAHHCLFTNGIGHLVHWCTKASDELVKVQCCGYPVEHQGVMGPLWVCPYFPTQLVQESLLVVALIKLL